MGELFWQGDPSRDLRILWNRLPHIPALKLLFYPKIPKWRLVQALVCVGALQQTRRPPEQAETLSPISKVLTSIKIFVKTLAPIFPI